MPHSLEQFGKNVIDTWHQAVKAWSVRLVPTVSGWPALRNSRASAAARGLRRNAVVFACALLLTALAGHGTAQTTARSKEKQAAETERAALRKKLKALKREIHETEAAREHAADTLAESEAAISEANRSLRELAEEQRQTAAKLAKLSKTEADLKRTVEMQQTKLSKLLREQYITGNEDRVKLLLSGDNPNRAYRDLRYMSYISDAQSKLLEELQENLQAVEKNRSDTEALRRELEEIAKEENAQKALLEKEKANRAQLLAKLSDKLASQRTEAANIQRDEKRLANLVNRLSRLIEQQRKANERRPNRQEPAPAGKKTRPSASTEQAGSGIYNDATPESQRKSGGFATSFTSLRGKLRLPVKGELVAKYGNRRGEGPSWKGLFIRTEEGTEVKAVADGQVVFADWLRGFGNLVIIDHGEQYLTIYGNTQAILKHAGDMVRTGDVIANTGNSGGIEQAGLYFEMRHAGRPFDPLQWVTIR